MICHEHQKVPKRLERLPDIALPSHYTLIFTPDLEKFVFQGEEVIDVQVCYFFNNLIVWKILLKW